MKISKKRRLSLSLKKCVALKKTLVLFAHPYLEHSKSNVELSNFYVRHQHYTFRDLYEEFPDLHIPAFRERKRIADYDRIIFHFPLIWFGIPPLLKLWIDEVFDFRWIIEKKESPIKDKEAVILVTTSSPESSFSKEGKYQYTVEDMISGFLTSLKLNKINIEEILIVYDSENLNKKEIIQHKHQFQAILKD